MGGIDCRIKYHLWERFKSGRKTAASPDGKKAAEKLFKGGRIIVQYLEFAVEQLF